jgi:hypothetical protein
MKRLSRHLFTCCSAVSLLLCLVACGLWVRSYYVGDQWIWSDGADRPRRVYRMGHRYVLTLAQGHISLLHDTSWWHPPQLRHVRYDDPAAANLSFMPHRSVIGFTWGEYHGIPMASSVMMPPFLLFRAVGIPCWFVVASAATLPGLYVTRAWRLRSRLHRGLCLRCGYDLRATPAGCPECGNAA